MEVAVYGPAGAEFDQQGNAWFAHEGRSQEYVLPYKENGEHVELPQPEDLTIGLGPGRITIGIRHSISRDLSRIDRRYLLTCSRGL